jgi:DNA polymerase-1
LSSLSSAAPPKPLAFGVDADAMPGTTLVRTVDDARRVVEIVRKLGGLAQLPAPGKAGSTPLGPAPVVHAWDTEVVDINLDIQSPVGHGKVICASFYSGPDVDYGNGPRVWIDNLREVRERGRENGWFPPSPHTQQRLARGG